MAISLRELVLDQEKRAKMGRQGREAAEGRTWQRSHEELLRTYERAIKVAGNLLELHI
jgi:hypothetical protein